MGDDVKRPTPDVTFEFEHDAAAPRRARRALRPLFPQPDPLADEVGLVASEFVSNVIRHTDDGGHMDAWDDDPLRLEVHDLDPTLPVPPDYADERGGHGLRIVDELADDWGASRDRDGKTMWAEFGRHSEGRIARSSTAEPGVETGELEQPSDGALNDGER
jgi:anti-sigma regulatory factor (Ser/Thr protein kinase)